MKMKERIVLPVSIMMGLATLLIPLLGLGRAASPLQPVSPSCDSFGVQRFQEKKGSPCFYAQKSGRESSHPERLQGETGSCHLLGHLVCFLPGGDAFTRKVLPR